ncbi:scavenger receptor class B member 1-like [Scleropages formosus]|uniref:Scavenger receptor class B member 1 n=1 Tax=Scleropages formosus TaxID=113540 RepID=A0A0P7URQ4_SCLFO|nr:scavenger receptor class B member 1-like [Scleropages formosus]
MAVSRTKLAVGLGIAGILTAVFGVILVFVGPIVIDDQIVKNVEINPKNSLSYTMWKDIPVPFFMSVYFFNVLNPKEILRGEKPMVEQRGPYVYREYRQKDNITFHPNNTVSYLEYRQYHFVRDMSVGDESDVVVIPNMLVLGAAVMMEKMPLPVRLVMSATFTTFNENAFLNKSVGELMWGYDSELVDFLNKYLPGMLPTTGKFGLFSEFNNSNTGLFTVFTGQDDIRKVHKVDSWNGLKKVNYWRTEQCNMINGTAGQMWPPFMTEESTLPFYSPDACRSMELVYERPGVTSGIPFFRFVAPKTLFANGTDYPPNEGFCPCRQSGIMNVSSCRHDAPVFMSHPHFYNGDPVLREFVLGLNPTEEQHGLFIDIHPETGVPLNVSVKLQLNLYMKKVLGISQTDSISEVVMPMIWFEEKGYIDGPVRTTFYVNLVLLPTIMEVMQYVFIALGLFLVLSALFLKLRDKTETVPFPMCSNPDPLALLAVRPPCVQLFFCGPLDSERRRSPAAVRIVRRRRSRVDLDLDRSKNPLPLHVGSRPNERRAELHFVHFADLINSRRAILLSRRDFAAGARGP